MADIFLLTQQPIDVSATARQERFLAIEIGGFDAIEIQLFVPSLVGTNPNATIKLITSMQNQTDTEGWVDFFTFPVTAGNTAEARTFQGGYLRYLRWEVASISAADIALPARPSERCAPTDRRRTPVATRRRSMLCDSANSCLPIAAPTIEVRAVSGSAATSATVSMPCARSLAAVLTPTPHSRWTGNGCRKAGSRSGGTSSRPSGLAS